MANLLPGRGKAVYGDSGYRGAAKRVKSKRGRRFCIAEQRSKIKVIAAAKLQEITERIEHLKASIRAAVEHPFEWSSDSSVTPGPDIAV